MTAPSSSPAPPPGDPYADEYEDRDGRRGPDLSHFADPRVLRQAGRLLRERQWWRALVGVVAISVVFVLLGQWQWHRHLAKQAKIDRIETNYGAPAVPISQVVPSAADPLPDAAQWHPLSLTGSYLADRQVVVRNRPLDTVYGYEVLVPFRTTDGATLVVDRGWVPSGASADAPDDVPAPPQGQVQLVVRPRPTEPHTDRAAPAGQAMRIDVPALAADLGGPVYRFYGVLASETPRAAATPVLLPRPPTDGGPHVAYTVQWYAFTLAAYVMFVWFLMREAAFRVGVTPRVARRSAQG